MDGMQAAILSAKLPYVLEWTSKRIANASLYNHYLGNIEEIILPKLRPFSKHTYHLYVIRTKKREELKNYLLGKGIETAIHYPTPLPFLPAYQKIGHIREDFPVSSCLQPEILSLPMYAELTKEMIVYISGTIKNFFSR